MVNLKSEFLLREKYPLKTYTNQYSYTDVYYLPTSSYYQIKDVVTEEVIVPFGDYTKLSCDSNGNYFKLNLTNWEYNRDYYIEIKIDRDGVIEYFVDKELTFTIEKILFLKDRFRINELVSKGSKGIERDSKGRIVQRKRWKTS